MKWKWAKFQQLSTEELYQLLKLRQDIFVVEQGCIYTDIDGLDSQAWHLFSHSDAHGAINASLRMLPISEDQHAKLVIGRVVVRKASRQQGVATAMMQEALTFIVENYPNHTVGLSSQLDRENFYTKLGFQTVSEPYDDAGIMHIEMIKK